MKFLLVSSVSFIGLFFLIFNAIIFNVNKIVRESVSKIFLWYLISLSIIEICCHAVGILFPNSNFFISHFYFGFQMIFLSVLYFKLISNKLMQKLIVAIAIVQFSYLILVYLNNHELFWIFNSYEIISSSLILVIYAIYFIFINIELEHKYYNFSIGLIIYLACSIPIFLSGKLELVLCENPYIDIWIFNSLFYILFQYFIFREYLFIKKKTKIKAK
jgi:hypothetical protein